MGFLAAIPLRFYLYAALAAALGYLLWHERHLAHVVKARNAEIATLTATITTERENTRKANVSANRYAARLQVSRGPRSPPAVLLCRLPAAKQARPAASGTDAAPVADDGGVSADVDIGPRLDVSFHACEENLIKLEELQRWVRER
jgi:hypothetical protein